MGLEIWNNTNYNMITTITLPSLLYVKISSFSFFSTVLNCWKNQFVSSCPFTSSTFGANSLYPDVDRRLMYRINSLNFLTFNSIVLISLGVDTLSICAMGRSLNLSINLLNCSIPFWSLFVSFVDWYSDNGSEVKWITNTKLLQLKCLVV